MPERFYRETPDAEEMKKIAEGLLSSLELSSHPKESTEPGRKDDGGFAYIDTFISAFELEFKEKKFTAKLMKLGIDDLFFLCLPKTISAMEDDITDTRYFDHEARHMAHLLNEYDHNFQETEPDLYKRWAMLNALSHISRFTGMDLMKAKRRYEEIGEGSLAQRTLELAKEYFSRGKEKSFSEEFRLTLVKEGIEDLLRRFPDPLLSEEERNTAIEEIKQYIQSQA